MARPRKGVSDADRILALIVVDETTGCWEWQGYRQPGGYGRVRANGNRKVLVHRWVYEHLVGPIPGNLPLDHLCRNPPCCNPDHLEPVTQRENTLRGVGQGALNAAKTECPKGHPYSEDNTYVDFLGRRVCRICRLAWNRRWRAKRAGLMTLLPQPDPAHQITVTGGGPFGRAWFDCSCGVSQTHASKHAANIAALRHYADVNTCRWCNGELYLCTAAHTDGPGPRLHCRQFSAHNYPTVPGSGDPVPAAAAPRDGLSRNQSSSSRSSS